MDRERTCISCGAKRPKGEMLRVVRGSDGVVDADPTGKAPGRGAYVCSVACLRDAISGRKLQRALRCAIDEDRQLNIADAAYAALADGLEG